MPQNFTDAVTDALQRAFSEAQRRKNTEVTENHLLWSFLEDPQGYFSSIIGHLNAQPQQLLNEIEMKLSQAATYTGATTDMKMALG